LRFHDLCAVLSQVQPDGSVYNLTQGYLNVDVESAQPTLLRVQLQATCCKIPKGHALRLSLSAACFPAYPMNPATGSPLGSVDAKRLVVRHRLMDAQIITLTVFCGSDKRSQVLLPVVSAS
jgi:uncharacterized protein